MLWKKAYRNTDGGPKTCLFSFSRERERQAAERYSRGNTAWLKAWYILIDEVLEYRRTGICAASLIEACLAESAVSNWPYSQGVRRLAELANDGHEIARRNYSELLAAKNWRTRYEAFVVGIPLANADVQRELILLGLRDRSSRIRIRVANEAVFAKRFEIADQIQSSALSEADPDIGYQVFKMAAQLRTNEPLGANVIGGEHFDAGQCRWRWNALRN